MTHGNDYLAVFLGSYGSARMAAFQDLSGAEKQAVQQEGMAAWKEWAEKHQDAIVSTGGPLGKTKRVSEQGIEDASNALSAYMVVRAESHEAAAALFEKHPHFTVFPGDAVEIMPVLPVRGG